MIEVVHRALAYAAVTGVAIGIAWSLLIAMRDGPRRVAFERFQAVVVGLIAVAALVGAAELVAGARPREDLHLVYALIAIGLLPLGRSFVPAPQRRRALLIFVAFVVLGGVVYRLFSTG